MFLAHERQLAHSDKCPGQERGVLVADFVGVLTLFERLTDVHEASEEGNERGGSLVLSDGRPVMGARPCWRSGHAALVAMIDHYSL